MPYADVNGLHMYYEVHGDGPPLLLLHGGTGSIPSSWIPQFADRFRVVAPEQMGHGRTGDAPDREFHYHDMAQDTVELMRLLGISAAVIVGYSDGGIIGLDIAIHHPERVSALVLTGVNSRVDGYKADAQEWARTFDPSAETAPDEYARLSPDGPEHWPVFMARLKPMWTSEPTIAGADLEAIATPTLIIIGDQDIVTPEHAVELFRTIPGSNLCVVPQAGHGVMPKETVRAFLDGLALRSS